MRLTRKRTEQDVLAFIMSNGTASMSQRTISKHIGHSSSTVARALESLEKQGLIKIERSDITSKPSTVTYTGKRKIKKSLAEVIGDVMTVSRNILDSVTAGTKVEPIDVEPPAVLDKSKIVLMKKLPDGQGYMIIVKQ